MENIGNHGGKKYEYLSNNYDTIYNGTEEESESMSNNYHSGMNYNYSQNLLNKSNGTNMYMNNNMKKGAYNSSDISINMNNSMNRSMNGNFNYGNNNKKYNSTMEKEKLINSKSTYQINQKNYNNLNYDSNEDDCSETHYHFENKYNLDKDLENNRVLIEPDELLTSRRNHMRTKMQVLIKVLVIVAIFFLLVFLITKFKKFLNLINVVIKWVGEQGSWSILLFILLFTLTSPLFMSVEIMCVGAGLIFSGVYGKFLGILVAVFSVLTGYVLGMSLCFFISRYMMHEFIYKKLMVYPIYLAFNQAINSNGLSFVLLIRLSPILPASVVSYILGVTSLKYKDFALGSISALPSISIFVYIGVLLQDISNISEMENHWANLIILFIGFILGVIAIAYISVVTKRRLNNLNIMNSSLSTTNIDIE
ncbi:SNARE associated Golgi protein [Plasmodium gonderi]|uniref:SNARE associated Golgi protein n=1 Tax=Plasmodium gonderi TaxID=77519 RepID=A0A1Y1JGF2_PLAGO|nr:SNARE associated Golgi protein [Plasmodium gonderi]GAW81601.1 SNARE associated Golgi protein [Plasmodium gonderi]